jgi:hypothetical protein
MRATLALLHRYVVYAFHSREAGTARFRSDAVRRFVVDDEFRVGFAREIPGYTLVRERPYPTWMPPRADAAARIHRRSAPPMP